MVLLGNFMINLTSGDILKSKAEAIVNTVNCVGVMGRGIALQFKKAYPENFKFYAAACKQYGVKPGKIFVVETGSLIGPKYILNFPTKRHWKDKSRMEDIESGLIDLVHVIKQYDIKSIAIPPLGCGLGGLQWDVVLPKIQQSLQGLSSVAISIYEPKGAPDAQNMVKTTEVPDMTIGRAILIGLVDRYFRAVMDPIVTILELQKLMYFMQESGQPLKLKYSAATYGPYAENLRHVLTKIEGHFIQGYQDGGDNPDKELSLINSAISKANQVLNTDQQALERFDRVVDLIEGYETSYGLELLSTVHWVASKDQDVSLDGVINKVHAWNERKKMFTPVQIESALNTLRAKQWV